MALFSILTITDGLTFFIYTLFILQQPFNSLGHIVYLGKHSSDIWDLVPGCLMWTIWSERNWRAFEDEEKTVFQLLELCQRTLFDWSRCWGFSDCSTLTDFISSIRLD